MDLNFGDKVKLPRRIQAETVDAVIATAIWVIPVLTAPAVAEHISAGLARWSILHIPLAILYMLFRDFVGGGTSLGKRLMGLRIIELEDGHPAAVSKVWMRDLLDIVPIVNLFDFIGTCLDKHGQKFMDKWKKTQLIEIHP